MKKVIRLTESELRNVIKNIINEASVVKNDLKCIVNPGLTPTGDDGTNKTYQKTIKGQDTSQVFGSNGGWVWAVPSGRITGEWGCKKGGGFVININGKVGGMGSELPEVFPTAYDTFNFDSSRNKDSFNTAGWVKGLVQIPKPTAASTTTNQKSTTTNTKTASKTTKSKVKYVKSNDLKDVKAFQDWLDANKSDEQLGQGKGWATGFPGGKLNKGKGYGTYGPRSNAAWEKYGNEYGQIKSLTLAPEVQSKIEAQNNLMYGPQTDIQGNPVNPQISRPS
jgi:hypothetical protein